MTYRTGPYAANGAQLANGMIDYLALMNARGGVNGVSLKWEECETGYKTDVGVECYERLKGNGKVAAVSPFSTGITYALLEKVVADNIVLFSMGYGRTSAAYGTVFPQVFNFPATYWSRGATSIMSYIADREGGAGQSRGQEDRSHPSRPSLWPRADPDAGKDGRRQRVRALALSPFRQAR
ncbi:MAG: ABC transporter substrate-binding protein [Geminicoccaceae bacterium]